MSDTLRSGWASVKLEEIVTARKGKKPAVLRDSQVDGFVPYLDIQAIERNVVRQFAEVESSKLAAENDLLVVWDGARSGWVGAGAAGAIGSTIMALSSHQVEPAYLRHFLASQFQIINNNTRGTGIPHVDPEIFWNLEVPLAPLAEQKRIVAKLEALLEKVDYCENRLARIPDLLRRFRLSVLAAACAGRLTANWREQNRAEHVGEGGAIENDFEIPVEWSRTSLRPLVESLDQGWSPKCEIAPSPSPDVWGVIKTTAVQVLSFIEEENKRLPVKLNPRPALELKIGDLLITRAGPRARAGVSCLVGRVRPRLMICDKVYRFRLNADKTLPEFLILALNAPATVQHIDTLKTGTSDSGVNLTQKKFLDIRIGLPPLAEQEEIVRRVDALFALADELKARLGRAQAQIDKLASSLLGEAFKGELVPSEAELARRDQRAYEPAGALLERIRYERGTRRTHARAKAPGPRAGRADRPPEMSALRSKRASRPGV